MTLAVVASEVEVEVDGLCLPGDLAMPANPIGLVLFAHGSGSSRRSPRNRTVAKALQARGLATLLFDLLTEAEGQAEDAGATRRFDIPFLARRLAAASRWCRLQPGLRGLPFGYFGASTGAAAALVAASEEPEAVRAVVSRGGRPDLAGGHLERVLAPVLLVVGGDDAGVLELNEKALRSLRCEKRLEVIPGATHLFEEPGTLEEAARLAGDWFLRHRK